MEQNKKGIDYAQNYDVTVKWLSEAFCGETLEVLGIRTGRIEHVFGYEPVDIKIKAERVDVIFQDELGAYYHLEEQRNMTLNDLYRFAGYHFEVARQWGKNVTDIILASGEVFKGKKTIQTQSGKYDPTVIDLTKRNGIKRLKEIREAVESGKLDHLLELVFVPLYGKERNQARSILAESVLRFELDLYKHKKMSKKLLAATIIMSNKFIDKAVLKKLWEDIEMLDIIEVAHEVAYDRGIGVGKDLGLKEGKDLGLKEGKDLGLKEGKDLGLKEGKDLGLKEGKDLGLKEGKDLGKSEYARELLLEAIEDSFDIVPVQIADKIQTISNYRTLKSLLKQANRCTTIEQFNDMLDCV